jgi:methyl-accepting chemotaxis protein
MKRFQFTIRAKISVLVTAGVLFLALVGLIGYQVASSLSAQASKSINEGVVLLQMEDALRQVQVNFQRQVQEWKDLLLRGNDPDLYAKHHDGFEKRAADVAQGLAALRRAGMQLQYGTKDIDALLAAHAELKSRYEAALKSYNPAHATAGQEVDRMLRGVDRPTSAAMDKVAIDVRNYIANRGEHEKKEVEEIALSSQMWTLAALVLSLPVLMALGFFISRGIIYNLSLLQKTITSINQGQFEARARVGSNDELGALAKTFNELLDSRVATLAKIQKENERLNESVLALLRAVAQIAQKDLTVKIPVSEDVTGAVSDALNLLTRETSKVLLDVSNISADVTTASLTVQRQADAMLVAAADDRSEVDHTVQTLSSAAHALNQIAELARLCDAEADNAIKSTQLALATVNNTVSGINSTRDVIRETEKRIKRLGERSQEISGVVNMINVIAERTHILALNASMHAASAGEAGRGFAVVADEVQRLAENARQATQQIAALVGNIQMETADTVNTMNAAISQIVEGSRLAEQAGQQMQSTQEATAGLVTSVKQIAANSEEQARASQSLLERAAIIKKSSEQASERLHEQSNYTNNLVEYAKHLLSAVRVFKLPG